MEVVFGGGPVAPGQISAEDFASLSVDTSRALRLGEISVEDAIEEVRAEAASKPLAPGAIRSTKLGDLAFLDASGNVPDPFGTLNYDGQVTGLKLSVSDKGYTFIPQNILEKGWVKDGKQYYFGNALVGDNLQKLYEGGELVDISAFDKYKKIAEENGLSTTGLLVPNDRLVTNLATSNIKSYDLEDAKTIGQIQGISLINGKPVYVGAPKGNINNYQIVQSWIQEPGTKNYTGSSDITSGDGVFYKYYIPPEKPGGLLGFINDIVSSDLFKIGSLALGAYGLYNLATAPAAAAASSAGAAAGSGLTPGAAGITGLTPGAAGITGITAPAGFSFAPGVGAATAGLAGVTDGFGLLDTTDFSRVGETGITGAPSTSGSVFDPFATAAPGVGEGIMVIPPSVAGGAATVAGLEAPGLSAMGGAQGITVPVQGGGVVSEMGFVPPGATPSLGDPGSFINNPDYLGSPVISEDYLGLTASDMPGGMNIQDALRMARTGMQLFGPQQQQLLGMGGYGGGGGQVAGVDSSGLLGLLQGKAGVPGVAPLLTPVSIPAAQVQPLLGLQMPQYQPLLGTTTQSLLG